MQKIVLDTTAFLGQFDVNNDARRIACKNIQAPLASKADQNPEKVGLYPYHDIAATDDTIWELTSAQQEIFYSFLDQLHTDKKIIRCPDLAHIEIAQKLRNAGLDAHSANTCACAIAYKASMIYTLDMKLSSGHNIDHMKQHDVEIVDLSKTHEQDEQQFEEQGLEGVYQDALWMLQEAQIDLLDVYQKLVHKRAQELVSIRGE